MHERWEAGRWLHTSAHAGGCLRRMLRVNVPPCAALLAVLQVSGDAVLQCLKMALDDAPTMHQALQARALGGCAEGRAAVPAAPSRRCAALRAALL